MYDNLSKAATLREVICPTIQRSEIELEFSFSNTKFNLFYLRLSLTVTTSSFLPTHRHKELTILSELSMDLMIKR